MSNRITAHLYDQPWLITQAGLDLICQVAAREGDVSAVLAKRGERPEETARTEIRGRVAVVPVNGPIFRYANLFTEISGATSVERFATEFQAAVDNPQVEAIIPYFGTPGGQAAGIHETAALIRSASAKKRVVGYVHENAASAGYWLAAACPEIVVDAMAGLGSIGVVIAYQKGDGDRTIEFVSDCSPKKRLDPQSEEGRAEIMSRANAMAHVFVRAVAGYRGVSVEAVLSGFGQGGILLGEEAVAAGMADRLGSLEGLIEELNITRSYSPRPTKAGIAACAAPMTTSEEQPMKKEELMAKFPEACQQIMEDGRAAGREEAKAAADATVRQEAAKAERENILGLHAVFAGEEQTTAFAGVVAAGVTVEQYKAIRGSMPKQAAPAAGDAGFRKDMLEAIQGAGAPEVGAGKGSPGEVKDFEAMVADHLAAQPGCRKSDAMQAVRAAYPKAYEKWLSDKQTA